VTEEVLARFHQAVAAWPDRVAVRDWSTSLDFAELDRLTAHLSVVLRRHGVRRGDHVGVSMARGARVVVALLAIWRAGAAYVPLDPAYPAERRRFMASDAGVRLALDDSVVMDALTRLDSESSSDVQTDVDDAAYVIYTSGSTGRPKGVVGTRGGVATLLTALERTGMYAPEHRVVGWNASMSFDASVQQWARVCRGDTIVVIDERRRTDPGALAAYLDEHGVQDLDLTPSHWDLLGPAVLGGRRLFVGGEPVPEPMWREICSRVADGEIEAINLYGPTECSVDATAAWFAGAGPHIGGPLPGFRAYVLDDGLRPAFSGELCLAGPGVTRGYFGRPGLTASRFVPDPFVGNGQRMYRTGDRVRWRDDGVLEFVGRIDRQVKLNGHRVELGEVEAALAAVPGVDRAVAVVLDGQLVAYYAGSLLPQEVLRHLAAALPASMLPAVCVPLVALPLTVHGKVDVDALPTVPAASTGARADVGGAISQAWAEVLDVAQPVGPDADFFALGGSSRSAVRVVARIRGELGVSLTIRELYRNPRLEALAALVGGRLDDAD
jgi:amino acid adenylation domain-containing protein